MKNTFKIDYRQTVISLFLLLFFHYQVCSQTVVQQKNNISFAPGVAFENLEPDNRFSGINFASHPSSYKIRINLVGAANIIAYGATMIGLNSLWYKNYPRSKFHFFNDNSEWKQVDKVGHGYSAYIEAHGSMQMWKWAGMSTRKSAWLGTLSALAYQTTIETLDGFSAEWGWSWGDIGGNVFGAGLLIGQELAWNEQRVKMKFSFHRKNYGSSDLNMRADEIYGNSFSERMLKDYNAQTYWLSANLSSFMPRSNLPSWLSISFGYGAEGMFGAESNIERDKNGNITFNRSDIPRYRQYYISPDIDLIKIKTKSKFLKLAFGALNAFKFPLPSVEYNSKGKFQFHLIHF